MPDPSFSDRSAPGPDVERPETSAALTAHGDVQGRLIDLVVDRARELKTPANAEAQDVDLARLREAVAALEGYLAALEFAAGARATQPPPADPPGRSSPGPDPQTWRDASEPGQAALIEATLEPNGSTPAPDRQRDYAPFRDQVTGLHSREGFDAVAGGELKRCRRYGRVFSLVLLQLPGAGEEGLRRAANAISTAIRESDLAGRQVDRTLAVALPEAAPNEARIVAERIIGHCEGVGVWDSESRVGLVTHPAHGETLVHLLDAARAQLTLPAQRVLSALDPGPWPA